MSCEFVDQPICCSLLDANLVPDVYPRKSNILLDSPRKLRISSGCKIVKEYIPSSYEIRHLAKAKEVNWKDISDEATRREILKDFIFNDIEDSLYWIDRVQTHMQSTKTSTSLSVSISSAYNKIYPSSSFLTSSNLSRSSDSETFRTLSVNSRDYDYLSRFKYTRSCPGGIISNNEEIWEEWIEPLTIHTRHPFSLTHCPKEVGLNFSSYLKNNKKHYSIEYNGKLKEIPSKVQVINVDFVLIQNHEDFVESVRYPSDSSQMLTFSHNSKGKTFANRNIKRYFFDIGSSTFDSSLSWFLCAYLQVGYLFVSILIHPQLDVLVTNREA
jgi:hypothetical protein